MGQYDFTPAPRTEIPIEAPELRPQIPAYPPSAAQTSEIDRGRSRVVGEEPGSPVDYINEFLMPGFQALDEAMKMYWSGIRVPTKDSYRLMRVMVTGVDKSLAEWRDYLLDGRARLPVASVDRGSFQVNPQKFSTPNLTMARRYSPRGDTVTLIRRPVPFLVEYSLLVWTSWKRENDYIQHQVATRFNPLAEFRMSDGHIIGNVQLKFNSGSDATEKEAGHDMRPAIRYEYHMTAEAWLPLPEVAVPTVLGCAISLRDIAGNLLSGSKGQLVFR